jgi:competence protein ComEC
VKALAAAVQAWWRHPGRRGAHRLFFLALAACAGIIAADALPEWGWPVWAGALAAAGLLWWKCRMPALFLPGMAAAFALLHWGNDRDPLRAQLAGLTEPGGALLAEAEGVITDAPEPTAVPGSYSLPLRVTWLRAALLTDDYSGAMLYVHLRGVTAPPRYGDRVRLEGLVRRPRAARNPGEFDLPAFLRREGMSAEFDAAADLGGVHTLERGQGSSVMAAALAAREWIGGAVTEGLGNDPDIAATVRAMVLGTREKTPAAVEEAFVASGTMHVFAVSGLHVAMFCGVVFWLLRRTPLPYGWILAVALPLVFFYVFITGLRPSAWRAAIMCAVFLCAPLLDRESQMYNGLGASALLLLVWNTQQLFQPGFTLSFGVLLAIAVLFPWFRGIFQRWSGPDPFLPRQLYTTRQEWSFRGRRFVSESVALSLASTVGSAPLMIYYFSLVTPVGIVANIFLVLLSNAILIVACACLMAAGAGLGLLAVWANKLNWALASLSVKLAQFFAAVPWGHLNVHPSQLWRGEVCEITVLELDRGGACVHIHTPDDRHWLVDAGGMRHYLRTVRPHLSRTPVTGRLHGLLLSHSDSTHSGAAAEVRRAFAPRDEPHLHAGETMMLEPGITLRCLFPPPGWNANAADDRCAVFMLDCRGLRVLLMNDAGFIIEKALLEGGEDLRADVLIKGWHGSDFSGLPEFINAVRPQTVIFSNADFPAAEAVPLEWKEMLVSKRIPFFDLARTGAVIIRREPDATATVSGFVNGQTLPLKPPL